MIRRAEQLFVQVNGFLVAFMLFAMFVLVFANVVARYVFGSSMNWAEEVTRFLMVGMAYLGMGLAMRERQHVAIEMVQEMLPRRLARLVRALVAFIILGFMASIAVLGYKYAVFAMPLRTPGLQLPTGMVYLVLPIGAMAFIMHLLMVMRTYIEIPEPAGESLSDQYEQAGGTG